MNHLVTTLPFIVFALVIILMLAKTDPRRQQLFAKHNNQDHTNQAKTASKTKANLSPTTRKLLAWSLALPIIPLIGMENYAGILMYAGALTVIGWLVSELPASVV
ncbi:hypothetical protein [Aliiglaciecola aliphaticivorans]